MAYTLYDAYNSSGDLDLNPQQTTPPGGLFDKDKRAFVDSVLLANKNLDWVQRLRDPNSPTIQVPGGPYPSTHLMSDDGKGYVFPSVVRINGKLVHMTEDQAYDYAKKTNTGIQLPQQQGSWFAANGYKTGTNVLNNISNGKPVNDPNYKLK